MKIKIPPSIVSAVLYLVYRLMRLTLRIEPRGHEAVQEALAQGRLVVLAIWHNELFCLPHLKHLTPDNSWVSIVSASKDGEILAGVLNRMGVHTARGSSSRAGVRALMGAVRLMKKERRLGAVTVDGPRGPRHEVKDGALFLAAKADALVVPVRVSCSRKYVFHKAWDKFELPLPFSRCRVCLGEPYALGADKLDADSMAQERDILCKKMQALGQLAASEE